MGSAARLEFMRGYLLRSDLHIARSGARSQSCYGGGFADEYRLFAYTLGWPPHRRDPSQEKLCGQIPASMLERAIQERLGRANLGLNVRHDLKKPASVTLSAHRQFEFTSLRQRVRDAGSKQIRSRRSAQQLRCKARQVPYLPVKILTPTR